MRDPSNSIVILLADDDADDRMLTRDALKESRLHNDLRTVEDGEELMEYLRRQGKYAEPGTAPRPGLILLDLNMPRKDGREALREIKSDPSLRQIPVVVLTTSQAEEDIYRTYDLGVNSFITKPITFEGLVNCMRSLGRYWFEIVDLPPGAAPGSATPGDATPDRATPGDATPGDTNPGTTLPGNAAQGSFPPKSSPGHAPPGNRDSG